MTVWFHLLAAVRGPLSLLGVHERLQQARKSRNIYIYINISINMDLSQFSNSITPCLLQSLFLLKDTSALPSVPNFTHREIYYLIIQS